MEHTVKDDCTHSYVGIAPLVTLFMVLFVAAMHGQELPNAPQAAAVKHQIPPMHKQGSRVFHLNHHAIERALAPSPLFLRH
jgi:hypothetical protein